MSETNFILSDEQIADMNRAAQDQGISGIPPALHLARAVESAVRAALAAQPPHADTVRAVCDVLRDPELLALAAQPAAEPDPRDAEIARLTRELERERSNAQRARDQLQHVGAISRAATPDAALQARLEACWWWSDAAAAVTDLQRERDEARAALDAERAEWVRNAEWVRHSSKGRAAFEANELQAGRLRSALYRTPAGHYEDADVERAWRTWQGLVRLGLMQGAAAQEGQR